LAKQIRNLETHAIDEKQEQKSSRLLLAFQFLNKEDQRMLLAYIESYARHDAEDIQIAAPAPVFLSQNATAIIQEVAREEPLRQRE
jgi:hypothetical protein